MTYIDAEKLTAEIRRRKYEWQALLDKNNAVNSEVIKNTIYEDENILDFIASLQQEQPNDMTEFEQEVYDIVKYVSEHHDSLIGGVESYAKRHAKMLLLIAIEQTKDEIKAAVLNSLP